VEEAVRLMTNGGMSFRFLRETDVFGYATAVLISVQSFLLRNANLNFKITLLLHPQALVSVKWRITQLAPWVPAPYSAS